MKCCPACHELVFRHWREITDCERILCEEEGKQFILTNPLSIECWKIQIDNGFLSSAVRTKRCDYGVYIKTYGVCYLIELKGRRLGDAIVQIGSTLSYFNDLLLTMTSVKARIVAKDSVPKYYDTKIKKLKNRLRRDYHGDLEYYTEASAVESLGLPGPK